MVLPGKIDRSPTTGRDCYLAGVDGAGIGERDRGQFVKLVIGGVEPWREGGCGIAHKARKVLQQNIENAKLTFLGYRVS